MSIFFIGVAGAASNISSCQAITLPGEYVLNQSIVNSSNSTCISINVSDVIFDGMGNTMDGMDNASSYGIYVYNSTSTLTNVTVKNVTTTDWGIAIRYSNVIYGTIDNNIVDSNSNGIYLTSSSSNNNLNNNTVTSNKYGIGLVNSNNNTLINNNVNSNGGGVELYFSSNNTLANNIANSNTKDGITLTTSSNNNTLTNNTVNLNDNGIYLYDSSNNNTLTNNTANSNTWGIRLEEYSDNNVLTNNNASSNNIGILIKDSFYNTLTYSTAYSNEGGISLEGSKYSILRGNVANSNGVGIQLYSADNNTLIDNNASSNSAQGIVAVSSSNNNTLTNNTISFNGDGLSVLDSSSSNILINNTVSSNIFEGITLSGSSNNTLTGNNMSNNSYNFHLLGSQESDFNNSIETSNLIDGKPVFYIKNASDTIYDGSTNAGIFFCFFCYNVTIKDLTLTKNGLGVFFWNTTDSKIENVTASLTGDAGIQFKYSSNNILINNNISANSGYGISLAYSSNNILSNNTADSNGDGFKLDFSSDNTLTNNTVNSNTGNGIVLTTSSNNNTLTNNTVDYNSVIGLLIKHSTNNSVSNNTISSGFYGVFFDSAVGNIFYNNTANFNLYGISLANSSSNTLTDNGALYSTLWDFYSISDSINNTVVNLSINPEISFNGKDVSIKSASSPSSDPVGYKNITKYINVTNTSADSWIFLNISYDNADIVSVEENTLRIWKYNGSWSQVPSTNGVETSENYVYSNITSFSIFAPLADPDNTAPDVFTLYTSPSSMDIGSSLNITVSVTDDHLNSSSVFAIVEHPDGFINTSLMALSNGDNYYINYTNTSVYGRYNVTINASDYAGNINNAERTWFVTKKTFNSIIRIHGEGNGTLSNSSGLWSPVNFPALITGETLNIKNISSRVIPQNGIWYNTSKEIVRYKINEYNSSKFVEYALDQNGLKQANGGYYAKIGWQGISYVALNGTANKLAILLIEQGNSSSDKKTMSVNDLWEMGDGFTLTAKAIDAKASPRQVWLELSKDGVKLDDMVLALGDVYSYSQPVAGESNVPIFTTYIQAIFAGAYSDYVQLRYTWLISDNITNITQGEVYGNFTVNLSTSTGINLTNSNNITLSQNTTVNLMESLYFSVTDKTSLEYYPFFRTPTSINASEADVSLDILTNSGIAGIIDISKMKDLPPGINRSIGLTPFGKYISINATQNIVDNIEWALIKIYYSEDELTESGLNESSLNISRLNETTSEWEVLNKTSLSWVNDAGLNTTDINGYSGFVWANVSRFSYYGIGKQIPIVTSTPTPTPTSAQGPNSGGDDVTDDTRLNETNTNIEIKEKHDLYINKDSPTSYKFSVSDPILSVNITGNINAGKITTTVEILKTISPFVKEPPPGIIYKNVNIWVGTDGFAVPKNIKDALIKYRVKKSWLSENNIMEDEIYLLIWDGDSWNKLETVVLGTDDSFIYLESRTRSFSNFAISGLRDTKASVPSAKYATGTKQSNTNATVPEHEENGWIIIFIGLSLISTTGYYCAIRKGWYKKL